MSNHLAQQLAGEYQTLVRLYHPHMRQEDLQVLVERLASITERFAAATRAREDNDYRPDAIMQFKRDLESLPKWFERYLKEQH